MPPPEPASPSAVQDFDIVVVGGGAAGLMTAIAAARAAPASRICVLEGSRKAGIKILASGGGRCNVTNRRVVASDFHGRRKVIARVLRRFDAGRAAAFFEEIGVALKHEPEFDKLFPVSNSARTVVDALLTELDRLGVSLRLGVRVVSLRHAADGYHVHDADGGVHRAPRVVVATGGKALPKSGSDGVGYEFVRAFGHTVGNVEPALVPLVLEPHPLADLSGIAVPVEIAAWQDGRVLARCTGPLLITHRGVSGPAAMDASRHWTVGRAEGRPVTLKVSFHPGTSSDELERRWLDAARADGSRNIRTLLSDLPGRLSARILELAGLDARTRLAEFGRKARRRLLGTVTDLELAVVDSRGFTHAEVTAGGVPLREIDPSTMESREQPGLFLVGEILDVDGRIGGFNFQWAWATGYVAGQALAREEDRSRSGRV